ncbi:MAG: DUF4278 domain-containing protein [Thermostichus sp. DG02_2_bins_29]
MELSYRGVDYNYTPATAEVSPSKVGGRYRGLDWRFRHLTKPVVLPTNLDMLYRGVAYRAEAPEAKASAAVTEPILAATESVSTPTAAATSSRTHALDGLARSLMMSHQRAIRIRQQAMLVRGVEKIGLHANVRQFWNRIQGKVHPTFRLTYDRTRVSMS